MLIRSGMGMQLSGSVGGVVASRNAGGAYLRNRTVPVNPNSTQQQAVRAAFGTMSQYWGTTLTGAQRSGWDAYAVATPLVNRLGDSITVSGFDMFMKTNIFLEYVNAALIDDAPGTPGLSSLGTITLGVWDVSDSEFQFTSTNPSATSVLVAVGPAVGPGVTFFKGPFTFWGYDTLASGANGISGSGGRYGAPVAGQLRPFRLTGIDNAGKLATPVYGIASVQA